MLKIKIFLNIETLKIKIQKILKILLIKHFIKSRFSRHLITFSKSYFEKAYSGSVKE